MYRWSSLNGNLPSGQLSLTVTDHMTSTTIIVNVSWQITIDQVLIDQVLKIQTLKYNESSHY